MAGTEPLAEAVAAAAERNAQRAVAKALRDLEDAAARLALPEAQVPNTRAALHAYYTHVDARVRNIAFFAVVAVILLPLFVSIAISGATSVPVKASNDQDTISINVYLAIAVLTLPWIPIVWLLRRTRAGGVFIRHRLTLRTQRAAVLCADIHERPCAARPSCLRSLDRQCRHIERDLLRAHRTVGTMASSSPRHTAARRHAAHVAGALREDLVRLDSEPDMALRDIAQKLITIGEQYAQGHVSALLPDDALGDVVPLSITRETLKESLRLTVAILAALGAALAVHPLLPRLGAPEVLRPWCYVAAALIPGILIVGPRRVITYLNVMP